MIRLHLTCDLAAGGLVVPDPDQARYLVSVMRVKAGEALLVFNGRDGEWQASVAQAGKRGCTLTVEAQTRPQMAGPDLELVMALVKRSPLETVIEKATELGAARIRLVTTRRTNAGHTNVGRLSAIAVEAAEQTGRLNVPVVEAPLALEALLANWPTMRPLLFCDEAGEAPPLLAALKNAAQHFVQQSAAWSILIGPEGGFSPEERATLRALPFVVPASLGPRILRADTAAIAALTLWQAALGDWGTQRP